MNEDRQLRICVIGAGTRFLGGISYYTLCLVNALAKANKVSAILMRQLLPTRFYPGWKRVGASLTRLEYDPTVRVFDGVDWYWLPSMLRALSISHTRATRCGCVPMVEWDSATFVSPACFGSTIAGGTNNN